MVYRVSGIEWFGSFKVLGLELFWSFLVCLATSRVVSVQDMICY